MDCSGKPAEAIGLAEKAMRVDPRNRDYYLWLEGGAYSQMGRYEEAIAILKRHLARYPNSFGGHYILVVDYTELAARTRRGRKRRKFCGLALTSLWMRRNDLTHRKIRRWRIAFTPTCVRPALSEELA